MHREGCGEKKIRRQLREHMHSYNNVHSFGNSFLSEKIRMERIRLKKCLTFLLGHKFVVSK